MITECAKETKELGGLLAQELRGGEVICLDGELGAGKTTFTQGLLQGLKVKGPYTSPTFVIMKEYQPHKTWNIEHGTIKCSAKKMLHAPCSMLHVYHIDAYRIGPDDILELGWKEIIANKNNVTIIEWSNRVKNILPKKCLKITLTWLDKNKRQISFV